MSGLGSSQAACVTNAVEGLENTSKHTMGCECTNGCHACPPGAAHPRAANTRERGGCPRENGRPVVMSQGHIDGKWAPLRQGRPAVAALRGPVPTPALAKRTGAGGARRRHTVRRAFPLVAPAVAAALLLLPLLCVAHQDEEHPAERAQETQRSRIAHHNPSEIGFFSCKKTQQLARNGQHAVVRRPWYGRGSIRASMRVWKTLTLTRPPHDDVG